MSTEVSPNASGQSVNTEGTRPAAPEKMSRESVTIISTLLVATGEPGGVYRVRPDGTSSLLYRAKATHVTTLLPPSEY